MWDYDAPALKEGRWRWRWQCPSQLQFVCGQSQMQLMMSSSARFVQVGGISTSPFPHIHISSPTGFLIGCEDASGNPRQGPFTVVRVTKLFGDSPVSLSSSLSGSPKLHFPAALTAHEVGHFELICI